MSKVLRVDPALLRGRPLPRPEPGGGKEARGQVLVIGGGAQTPGAALLAGVAALRAGAGKLRIATGASVAAGLGVSVPEARVYGLPETAAGGVASTAARTLASLMAEAAGVALGPGLIDPDATAALTKALIAVDGPAIVIDAGCLKGLAHQRERLARRRAAAVLTPHAGEMAGCLGVDVAEVEADPLRTAREAAAALRAVVVLKGRRTYVAAPGGEAWENAHGNAGLATSGSGDVLAGIIAGLLARGADPATAALWGVWMHAEAGVRLAAARGPLGYLARELPGELPAIMAQLSEA